MEFLFIVKNYVDSILAQFFHFSIQISDFHAFFFKLIFCNSELFQFFILNLDRRILFHILMK